MHCYIYGRLTQVVNFKQLAPACYLLPRKCLCSQLFYFRLHLKLRGEVCIISLKTPNNRAQPMMIIFQDWLPQGLTETFSFPRCLPLIQSQPGYWVEAGRRRYRQTRMGVNETQCPQHMLIIVQEWLPQGHPDTFIFPRSLAWVQSQSGCWVEAGRRRTPVNCEPEKINQQYEPQCEKTCLRGF